MTRPASASAYALTAFIGIGALASGAWLSAGAKPGEDDALNTSSVYILGPARELLARGLYERADLYFHKGAQRTRKEAFKSFFHRWKDEVSPSKHAHTAGEETAEILPWLRLATRSDPNNIELYLVASYWLTRDLGRPDLAIEALTEAREKNPDRYELALEQARVELSRSNFAGALNALDLTLKLLREHVPADREQAEADLKFILIAKSFLLEAEKHYEAAVETTRQLVKLVPSRAYYDRLELLEAGDFNPPAAKERLEELFYREQSCDTCDACACPDHEHHGEHDHPHPHGEHDHPHPH